MSNETKIPSNHVVGVLGGARSVDDTVSKLRKAGYEDVLVMNRVEGVGEGTNPLSALIEKLAGHLTDETGYLDQYKEATENGATVIAVGSGPDDAPQACEILESEGAVNVRFFGRLAVTDMSPGTNPSAPSDETPKAPPTSENG